MEMAMNINQLHTLSYEESLLIEGGNWVRTGFGVVGAAAGGTITFVGVSSATSPVLTPFGGAVVGGLATPAGAAGGFHAGVETYDFFFGK